MDSPTEFKHFRPIRISHFIMLMLEKIYMLKLNKHIQQHNLISNYQYGCRPTHSTELAMISVIDRIKKYIDNGYICALVSLDLKNAFPSVHREIFLKRMKEKFKISDFWLRDYFTNRKQFVQADKQFSETIDSLTGLIQGRVLGPIFFTYFINALTFILTESTPEIFVGDSNLIFFNNNLQIKINKEMNTVCKWVNENCLKLNNEKKN